jgi:hypothetical protein
MVVVAAALFELAIEWTRLVSQRPVAHLQPVMALRVCVALDNRNVDRDSAL